MSVYGLEPPVPAAPGQNLIQNPGFEQGITHWTSTDSAQLTVDGDFPHYDNQAGRLSTLNATQTFVYQEVRALTTGTYTLAAFGASNVLDGGVTGSNRYSQVTLGVNVDGRQQETRQVAPYTGYLEYAFTFQAQQGSIIKVWYYAPQLQAVPDFTTSPSNQPGPYAVIDDVSLTLQ